MPKDHINSYWQDGAWVPVAAGERNRQGNEELPLPPIDRAVLVAATETGDLETALRIGREHADASFDAVYGAEVAALEAEADFVRKRTGTEAAGLAATDRELVGQPAQIDAPYENGGIDGPGNPYTEVPPHRWQLRDQLTACLSLAGVVGLGVASFYSVQATFSEAHLPIFENNPHLPHMLAVMPAAASLGVKLIGNVFTDPANRDRYRKGIAILGGVAFFAWVPMFSGLFEGLSGVFDPFAEPKHTLGWSFNVGHLLTEVLIGAGLYAQLDAMMAKYAPSTKIDNPVLPALERARAKQVATSETWIARLARIEARLVTLYAIRNKTRTIVEAAIRQRMNETPRDGLL